MYSILKITLRIFKNVANKILLAIVNLFFITKRDSLYERREPL